MPANAAQPVYPDLAGKVAVVTGGSRGIGAVVARMLAAQGARVVVNGRDKAAIDAVAESISESGGVAVGVAADCADPAATERLREECERQLGPADILIAFAGGGGNPVPLAQMTPEQWQATIDANLTSAFLTLKAFVPGMAERGRGSVVTAASTAGRLPGGAALSYAAAKAGLLMLTRHIAGDVAASGVRLNCVSPGAVLTERSARHMSEEIRERVANMYPLKRMGVPEDVAAATLFLASDASSWISGVTLDVAGGRIML